MMFRHLPAGVPARSPVGVVGESASLVTREGGVRREEGRLVVVASEDEAPREGQTFLLGARTTLGRSDENHVVIQDPYSSQKHAAVFIRNGQYWVQDLGSKNGTFLNEVPLKKPTVLADGDQLRIGGIIFKFIKWT
ncbi:MAG: FHA domain-containing protein, partial [Clostridia bacterium]|nr:FHA domain-containing protein [Clostridia bacterium]